jgi:hypothetical protein
MIAIEVPSRMRVVACAIAKQASRLSLPPSGTITALKPASSASRAI